MAGAARKSAAKAGDTDKRKVVMRSVGLAANGDAVTFEATDYVPESMLDVYVADAATRWQYVNVEDGYDAGPGGVDGPTQMPAHLEGKTPTSFGRYGGPDTPENALDEHLASLAQNGQEG